MKPDKQTWDLLIGALKGSLDAAEKFRFETWIAETENRRFYDNLTRVWREIQQRAADYEPDRDKLWQQLRQRIGTPENPHSTPWGHRRGTSLLRMAAAAADFSTATCHEVSKSFPKALFICNNTVVCNHCFHANPKPGNNFL